MMNLTCKVRDCLSSESCRFSANPDCPKLVSGNEAGSCGWAVTSQEGIALVTKYLDQHSAIKRSVM